MSKGVHLADRAGAVAPCAGWQPAECGTATAGPFQGADGDSQANKQGRAGLPSWMKKTADGGNFQQG